MEAGDQPVEALWTYIIWMDVIPQELFSLRSSDLAFDFLSMSPEALENRMKQAKHPLSQPSSSWVQIS
jgi:hypothetical protein